MKGTMKQINMEEQIKLLIEFQGLDKEIFAREKALAAKPDEIKRLDELFKEKEAETKTTDDELKKVQLAHKDKDIQLSTKEEMIKKFEGQLYQVKTNKEYVAMEHEISGVKADKSVLEEEIIKLLDKIDEAEKAKKEKHEYLKQEQKKIDGEKKRIDEESKKVTAELNGLKEQRAKLAEKADATILSKYERILHNKDGLALVPARNHACQGCFLDLPPQVINEISMKEDLVFCESCARILYLEEGQ